MILSSKNLRQLCNIATYAALEAGKIINEYSGNSNAVFKKDGGNSIASQVVTEVDILSQKKILEILSPTLEEFDLALLTEESVDNLLRLEKDYFWCIDPLDGTLPFIEGTPGYAVSISLVTRDGVPVIGVIYNPVSNNVFSGAIGCGVYKNGVLWRLSSETDQLGKPLLFYCDRSFLSHSKYDAVLDELTKFAEEMAYYELIVISHGGAVMNACWALENAPACYFKFPKLEQGGGSLWDYAATACIFQEAGAVVSDIEGDPMALNRSESTFMNHNGILYATDNKIAEKVMALHVILGE